jgi:hypothetical protein
MAKNGTFNVTLDLLGVERLAESVGRLDQTVLAETIVNALNITGDEIFELAKDRMNADINLSDEYLRSKMDIERATPGKPEVTITARSAGTVLGRFDAKPVVVDTKGDASNLKGNKALGIAPGKKQAGVTVQVRRSAVNTNFTPRGFLMPLKGKGGEQGANGLGVFARRRSGVKKNRYGPAVYQLFGYQADQIETEVYEKLDENLFTEFERVLSAKGIG